MNNKQKEKILENVKLKISISNFEKEEKKNMNFKSKFILKNIGIAACVLISMSGVAFAGSKIVENIEKIWKEPEKIENLTNLTDEITEESKDENITEVQAKENAINTLKEIGLNTDIVETNHYKDTLSNQITYSFTNKEQIAIDIDGPTGKFISLWRHDNVDIQHDLSIKMTVDEAKEVAMKYYKLLGFEEGEYENTSVRPDGVVGSEEKTGHDIYIVFTKKYGEIHNPFERISFCIHAKTKDFSHITVSGIPFDNNEIMITKDKAIQIALEEDAKIKKNNVIEEVDVEKMIVMMNTEAFERANNTEEYYKTLQELPWQERTHYNVETKVRNAWVVVITYDIYYDYNCTPEKRYNEGQYSYFVDCTTGEIIGGYKRDYRDSLWTMY